ncbi:LamG-like jellyroll fold domain-containing protein [Streptomyces anulatus]
MRPTRVDGTRTVLSQDAGTARAFTLGLTPAGSRPAWSFSVGGARVAGGLPEAGDWAYVLGQYDAETGTVRLYVNGREVGEETAAVPVAGEGDFQIGRARGAQGYRDRWQGEIGDVRAFDLHRGAGRADGPRHPYRAPGRPLGAGQRTGRPLPGDGRGRASEAGCRRLGLPPRRRSLRHLRPGLRPGLAAGGRRAPRPRRRLGLRGHRRARRGHGRQLHRQRPRPAHGRWRTPTSRGLRRRCSAGSSSRTAASGSGTG